MGQIASYKTKQNRKRAQSNENYTWTQIYNVLISISDPLKGQFFFTFND